MKNNLFSILYITLLFTLIAIPLSIRAEEVVSTDISVTTSTTDGATEVQPVKPIKAPLPVKSITPMSGTTESANSFLEKLHQNRPTLLDRMMRKDGESSEQAMMRKEGAFPGNNIAEVRQHIGNRMDVASSNLDNFITRLEERITKIESMGKDVSDVQALLDDAKQAQAEVEAQIEATKILFTTDTASKETVQAQAALIKSAVLEARDAIKAVIDEMKSSFSQSETTSKVETEITAETVN